MPRQGVFTSRGKEFLHATVRSFLHASKAGIPWSAGRFHRNNQSYYMMIYICRFLLEDILMPAEKRGDAYRLNSFVDDGRMYDLYEKFVYEYYRSHFPSLKPEYQKELRWAPDVGGSDDGFLIMRPDITLTSKDGGKILFIDTKYLFADNADKVGRER